MTKIESFLSEFWDTHPVYAGNSKVAFISTRSGAAEVWELNLNTGEMCQRTFLKKTVFALSANIKYGMYIFAIDVNGSEHGQLFVLPFDSDEPRQLTDDMDRMHFAAGFVEGGKEVAYLINTSAVSYDVRAINIDTLAVRDICKTPRPYAEAVCMSPDGKKLIYNINAGVADMCNYVVDIFTGEQKLIAPDDSMSAENRGCWTADGKGLYMTTDRDGEFRRIVYCDMAADKISFKPVFSTEADSDYVSLSGDGELLAVLVNDRGFAQIEILNAKTWEVVREIKIPDKGYKPFPGESFGCSWIEKEHRFVIALAATDMASRIFMVNADTGSVEQITSGSILAEGDAVKAELRSFKSYDGLEVPYWFYVPHGKKAENLPTVIEVHGGPESQTPCAYYCYVQCLVNSGIAVAAPNIRGSMGYGKTYTHLDDVEKRLDSIKDIISLADHLVAEGFSDEKKMAISGKSYGGFASLSCAARYPEKWACVVDVVGIFNLQKFMQTTPAYRRPFRASEYGTLEDNFDMLYEVSPIAKVDDIVAPMIVIHGANDPRVPISETEDLVAYLKGRGVEVEYHRYEDEGHGLKKLPNLVSGYTRIVEFVGEHLLAE